MRLPRLRRRVATHARGIDSDGEGNEPLLFSRHSNENESPASWDSDAIPSGHTSGYQIEPPLSSNTKPRPASADKSVPQRSPSPETQEEQIEEPVAPVPIPTHNPYLPRIEAKTNAQDGPVPTQELLSPQIKLRSISTYYFPRIEVNTKAQDGPVSTQEPPSPKIMPCKQVQDDALSERCRACREARASPEYMHRLRRLLTFPLYCVGCQTEHPSILFSYSARNSGSDANRLCIGHEGYFNACPHLRVSLADINNWKENARLNRRAYTARCEVDSCSCTSVTTEYHPFYKEYVVHGRWCASFKGDSKGSHGFGDDWLAELVEMHRSHPQFFCPHLQITPDRLFLDIRKLLAGYKLHTSCAVRLRVIRYHESATEAERINSWERIVPCRNSVVDHSWVISLDPESYGHFTDQDTKHITWCDERSCMTMHKLLQNSCLMQSAMRHPRYREGFRDWPATALQVVDKRLKEEMIGMQLQVT